jgi:uncharacterized surface protein with fasciclin (FAS1) repeats
LQEEIMRIATLFALTGLLALVASTADACPREKQTAAHTYSGRPVMKMVSQVETKEKDIVDTAVGAEGFKTLVAAVKAAGLVETLKGDGPFTVFAPTDEAFSKIPKETLDSLLKPENKDKLVAVLTYHVVPGKVMAADVVKLKKATTVQGDEATVSVKGDKVMIDGATVVKTDIECSNGVIHVIDAVIMPK